VGEQSRLFFDSLTPMHFFHVLCSIIFERLSRNGRIYEEATTRHLNEYGEAGLRTLALAYRKIDESEYATWNDEFQKAKTSIGGDREAMLERVSDMMERELILIGATAVEDKLQKGVDIAIFYIHIINIMLFYFLFFLL
jgi:magnesium-transporting ATPase (P-type)